MPSLTLKRHNSFQNLNNRKATHSFSSRPLIFKLQQEVLKFNDNCVSWSYPRTDLATNLLNLENRNFENVTLKSSSFKSNYLTLLYLKVHSKV